MCGNVEYLENERIQKKKRRSVITDLLIRLTDLKHGLKLIKWRAAIIYSNRYTLFLPKNLPSQRPPGSYSQYFNSR